LESRSRSITFSYEIWRDADAQLLATAESTHVICGKDGRPKQLPEPHRHLFSAAGRMSNGAVAERNRE
jgi:acyl-CoA thioesterase FadM